MHILYAGFNLYGQIINEPESLVRVFKEYNYPEAENIELCCSYCLIQNKEGFHLHGLISDKTHTEYSLNFPEIIDIEKTTCTDKWCLFLKKSGEIIKWEVLNPDLIQPVVVSGISVDQDKVVNLISSPFITLAISEKGTIFNIPNPSVLKMKLIKQICVGREHCLILDTRGNVYSFGRGSRGQLGHGCLEDEDDLRLIEGLAGIKVASIAAGGWHSLALSAEGDIYSWGWNLNGQLGLNATDSNLEQEKISAMASPHVVNFPENVSQVNVVEIACGTRHSVALLENKQLYGCGWNKYCQLGLLNKTKDENVNKMEKLLDLQSYGDCKIKCGPWSTVVLIK